MEGTNSLLSTKEKENIIFCYEEGYSYSEIVEKVRREFKREMTRGAVGKIVNKYRDSGTVESNKSPGAPSNYSEWYKRFLVREEITMWMYRTSTYYMFQLRSIMVFSHSDIQHSK